MEFFRTSTFECPLGERRLEERHRTWGHLTSTAWNRKCKSLFWYFYTWYNSSWTFHDGFWFYIDGQVLQKHIVLQRNELHASGGCGHRQCPAGKGGCQTPPNWTGSHRNRPLEHQWCPRYRSVEPYHLPAKSEDIARLSACKCSKTYEKSPWTPSRGHAKMRLVISMPSLSFSHRHSMQVSFMLPPDDGMRSLYWNLTTESWKHWLDQTAMGFRSETAE